MNEMIWYAIVGYLVLCIVISAVISYSLFAFRSKSTSKYIFSLERRIKIAENVKKNLEATFGNVYGKVAMYQACVAVLLDTQIKKDVYKIPLELWKRHEDTKIIVDKHVDGVFVIKVKEGTGKKKHVPMMSSKNLVEGKMSKGGRNKPPITPRPSEPSAQGRK